jgi:hypothetical protein
MIFVGTVCAWTERSDSFKKGLSASVMQVTIVVTFFITFLTQGFQRSRPLLHMSAKEVAVIRLRNEPGQERDVASEPPVLAREIATLAHCGR